MKKRILYIIIGIVLIIAFLTIFINLYMIKTTVKQIIEINDLDSSYDAILVLGCKAYSTYPSEMLELRLQRAYELYQKLGIKIILSGDHGEPTYDEVNVMKEYLINLGVPRGDLFLDHAGFNTYDSVYRVKNIFQVKRVVIVSQKYHLYRALYLANSLNLDSSGLAADDLPYKIVMLKNEVREIFSRDKNFFKGIFKPKSKYLGEIISLEQDGIVTDG